ncbi:hypothetical protein MKX01_005601 [Papaver californicum]|nr:hypothetical protein MKX01_005601 [Papaver californicum]
MKLTCLSKGGGFHFPPCYIINVCEFNILLDCPIDLSALTIFSPIPTSSYQPEDVEIPDSLLYSCEPKRRRIEKTLHADDLIHAEPCYRTVTNLNLWDASSIDLVLISSPMGMLGLPFLTRNRNFSAKIYATEAATTLGRLTMLDLVSMQKEFKQYYVQKIWTNARRVHSLKYGEETCFNETLIIKPFSSGLEIGSSNWTICSSGRSITWLSSSIFDSGHIMNFDYHSLQGNDVVIFSDLSMLHGAAKDADGNRNLPTFQAPTASDVLAFSKSLVNTDESSEEMDKLAYIRSHAIESVKAGGCVLIPIGRLGIVLQLLEQISLSLESSNLKDYTNVVLEWVCRQRQEKLYSGEALFVHGDLIKRNNLHLFKEIHSPKFLMTFQEPCIVFCHHWSLRIGPVVHFLRRWSGDHNSLLVLEQGVDAELALLPFKPVAMKVLQCSFLSGIKMEKVQPMLDMLQPKHVLFPEDLRQHFPSHVTSSFSCIHYSINKMLYLPV